MTNASRIAGTVALAAAMLGPASNLPAQSRDDAAAGLYRVDDDRFLVVRGEAPGNLSILDSRTGMVRNLIAAGEGRFTHGPTRSRTTPVAGAVTFGGDGSVVWESDELGRLTGRDALPESRDVIVPATGGAELSGSLYLPPTLGPHPVTVVVPLGDRTSLWEPAMWLLASGTGVFVYDQRGTGRSAGDLWGLDRNSHTLESLQLADDAVSVIRRVRRMPGVDSARVGILGWSQGGWVAAMAISRIPGELAWFVNIAANANPWPEQAEQRFLARVQREGFTTTSVHEAAAYFGALRDVAAFRIGWNDFVDVTGRYDQTDWYRTMREIFPFFFPATYGEALVGWSADASPEVFFRRISITPTLGVYFQFDQSNPPDSAVRFRRTLLAAGNPDVEVRTFRGVNHGAWKVDGYAYDTDAITGRDPSIFEFVADWVLMTARDAGR